MTTMNKTVTMIDLTRTRMSIIWTVRAVPWMHLSGWCFLQCVLVCMYVSKCITLVGSRRFGLMDGTD